MKSKLSGLITLLFLLVYLTPGFATTITISNLDGAGEGFNDPVLGAQRLAVFNKAAGIWEDKLDSNIEIIVQANFDGLDCDQDSAILGSAGAVTLIRDFTNAPVANTWYPVALANAIANEDHITNVESGGSVTSGGDIVARFNSNIGEPGCLEGSTWYLGLDNSPPEDTIDLLGVVLHELGHGLGFASYVDESSGAPLQRKFDIFSTLILDNTINKTWNEMSRKQVKASAINTGNLVWDGQEVLDVAGSVLAKRPTMAVTSPALIDGDYEVQTASFGSSIDAAGVSGNVVLADDGTTEVNDGCESLINGAAIVGNIALIDRGTCNFTDKVKNAQDQGAIAVIIANNVSTGLPPMGGSDPTITIPSVGISLADGDFLKANAPVAVNLHLHPNLLAGADDTGRVQLYAPNPIEPGSSISHWDIAASPDLLMEPFDTLLQDDVLDITPMQMADIGWTTITVPEMGHDLEIISVTTASSVVTGTMNTVTVTVANQGSEDESSFDVSLADNLDGPVGTATVASLLSGNSISLDFTWMPITLGDHSLTATADTVTGETDTVDNIGSTLSTVLDITHDVAVISVDSPTTVNTGTSNSVIVTVVNQGTEVETFDVTLVDDIEGVISTQTVTSLAAGSSTAVEFIWDLTTILGDHVLSATADTVTGETDIADNSNSATSTVITPPVGVSIGTISPNNAVSPDTSVFVTVDGTGFVSGTSVRFENGSGKAPAASNISIISATQLTATISVSYKGRNRQRVWDVRVTNPDSSTDVLADGFTVIP